MDAKAIIKKLKGESTKTTFSFYLSIDPVENFKKACEKEGVNYLKVIEELMEDFTKSCTSNQPVKRKTKSLKKN